MSDPTGVNQGKAQLKELFRNGSGLQPGEDTKNFEWVRAVEKITDGSVKEDTRKDPNKAPMEAYRSEILQEMKKTKFGKGIAENATGQMVDQSWDWEKWWSTVVNAFLQAQQIAAAAEHLGLSKTYTTNQIKQGKFDKNSKKRSGSEDKKSSLPKKSEGGIFRENKSEGCLFSVWS